jgi:hypothetical protein
MKHLLNHKVFKRTRQIYNYFHPEHKKYNVDRFAQFIKKIFLIAVLVFYLVSF